LEDFTFRTVFFLLDKEMWRLLLTKYCYFKRDSHFMLYFYAPHFGSCYWIFFLLTILSGLNKQFSFEICLFIKFWNLSIVFIVFDLIKKTRKKLQEIISINSVFFLIRKWNQKQQSQKREFYYLFIELILKLLLNGIEWEYSKELIWNDFVFINTYL